MADKESAPQCENEKEVKTDSAETKAVQVEGKEGSPKSSPSKIETNEALQHLVQGKRHLLVRDVNSAVNSLQEACRLLAEQYGETADPCGEAYFFYGKALLELSRIETGVLGNALDGVPEGDDADTSQTEDPEKLSEEERMQVVEEVDEALEENFITLEKARHAKDGKGSASEIDKETGETLMENGETQAKAQEANAVAENGVDMEVSEKTQADADKTPEEVVKSDSDKATATDADIAEDGAAKAGAEGSAEGSAAQADDKESAEEMEVDGATLSTAGGDASSGDGKQPGTDTAVVEPGEDKSAAANAETVESKPEDKTTEVKEASKESGDKPAEPGTVEVGVETNPNDTVEPATEASAVFSADIEAKEATSDTTKTQEAVDTPTDKAADVSAEKAAESADKDEKAPNDAKPVESTEGDEEEDGDDEEAEDAPVKEDGEGETKEDAGEEAKDGDKGEEDGAEGEEGADTTKEGDTSRDCDTEEGEEGEGDGAKEGDDEEEDVPNIQLAWEVLELAKIIFTRQAKDKPSDLKLSEVYQKLGEVSIEAENYSQAVDDLGNCLTIQKKHLDADDRLIAETHYHLGVAHSLANQYSEAIAAFQASVDTILARVQRLQRQILDRENGKKIEHEDPFYKEENEIKELEDLIPDMKEKIADMRDMKAEAQKKIAEVFAASGGAGPSTSAAPISPVKAMMTSRPAASAADGDGEKKEAHSIGHLVKRKRLSEPAAEEDAKRTKQENGHNGVNGHAAP
ncbi:protein HGV2-like isoform X2 [Amphibalanus amphitrite]|uniref:protein HGV2-like isoform X2 n=1 Tax=Amphibalanus amphitrite TaxID=1232801 RepID=UPI001C9147BC|nr:protein HGV2-like isoform X2 [Amphibalanus amphitrite]